MRTIRDRLTYANAMSTLAVFIALGGSSYAIARIGSEDIRNNSIRSEDIRDGTLRSRDFGSQRLVRARAATTTDGGVPVFGHVSGDGTLTRASGVTSVIVPAQGVYCLVLAPGLAPSKLGLVATPDFSADSTVFAPSGNHAIAEFRSSPSFCNPSSMLEVNTGIQTSTGALARQGQGFYFTASGPGVGSAGPPGPTGPAGPAGTARAYGYVTGGGILLNAKNIASVSHPSKGVWCIKPAAGINPDATAPVVTPVSTYATDIKNGLKTWADLALPGVHCPAGNVGVVTGRQVVKSQNVSSFISTFTAAEVVNVVSEVRQERSDESFTFVVP